MAKIFGETEEIMVWSDDLHVDHNTHELIVEEHGTDHGLKHVATEAGLKTEEVHHVEKSEQMA